MVTVEEAGIAAGAVYSPEALIDPAEADQVTLAWPVAVNCCVAPSKTLTDAGETVTGGAGATSVTVAWPVRLPAPAAVIVTMAEEGIAAGAAYNPAALIDPADADHVTADGLEAVNCWVVPSVTLTVAGEMVIDVGLVRVTVAVAAWLAPVALMVTVFEAGIVAGAVYSPVEEMVPAVAVQVTAAPPALNC